MGHSNNFDYFTDGYSSNYCVSVKVMMKMGLINVITSPKDFGIMIHENMRIVLHCIFVISSQRAYEAIN